MSEDPIGLKAGDSNVYRYVFNNPIAHKDPTGKTIYNHAPALVPQSVMTSHQWIELHNNQSISLTIVSQENLKNSGGDDLYGFFAPTSVTSGLIILDPIDFYSKPSESHRFVAHELNHAYNYFMTGNSNPQHGDWQDEDDNSCPSN